MKTTRYLFFILLALFSLSVKALQHNILQVPDVTTQIGEFQLPVKIENTDEIVGIQFDFALPDGVTAGNVGVLSNRSEDHIVTVNKLNNGVYRVLLYSPQNRPLRGQSGIVMYLPVILPASFEEGSEHSLTVTNVTLAKSTGENVLTEIQVGKICISKLPDLIVNNITCNKQVLNPGENVVVAWQIENIGGMPTNGGWSEQISFVSEDGNFSKQIASTHYDGFLDTNGVISRQVEVTLPMSIGLDGEIRLQVRIVPDIDAGESIASQGNNIQLGANSLNLSKTLYLELPQVAIDENTSSPVRCKLSRSGSWAEEEIFVLTKTEDERLDIPSSVTISKGQSGVYFYVNLVDNDTLDSDTAVAITVSGNGYEAVSGKFLIEDNEFPALTAEASKVEINEGETFQLTIQSERALSEPVTLYLTSDHPKRFTHPAQVTLPAGEKEVTVDVEVVNDNLPDVTVSAAFTVSAAKHNAGEALVILYDDDVPEIELSLTQNSISEYAGLTAVVATLRRVTHSDNPITVKISDDANGRFYYSTNSITLDAGVTEAQFTIGVIDNNQVDGVQTFTVTAAVYISSCSCSASGTSAGVVSKALTVLDNDGPALVMTSSKSMLIEGDSIGAELMIARNTSVGEPLTVTLTSDNDEVLEYEHTVTIPADRQWIKVPVVAKADNSSSEDRTVVFTATSEGYTQGSCWMMITDRTLPDATIDLIELLQTEIEAGDTLEVGVTIMNQGVVDLPTRIPVTIYMNGHSTALAKLYTQETVEPGCITSLYKKIILPDVTGERTLRVVVNEAQSVKELTYLNNTVDNLAITLLPKFTATVQTDKAIYKQGEPIIISGEASGSEAANTEVEVYIINDGVRQTETATTDADGQFSITWQPYANQSGHFIIGACYPGEGLETEQAAFDVYGLKRATTGYMTCETLVGEPYKSAVALVNPGQLTLTDIKVEVLSAPENCTVEFTPIDKMGSEEIANLKFTLTGSQPSAGSDWEQIKARVVTAEGAYTDFTLYYYCRSPKGQLQASISDINTTMIKGASRDYSFTVVNQGKGSTGKISLALPDVPWMKAVTPNEMASLAYGETATIVLRLTPTEDMQLNVPVSGRIGINCENGDGISLNYRIEPVSESTGTLIIDVCDEYTYYTTEAPHVSGAQVLVKHPITGAVVAQGLTGEDGKYSIELPEGYYKVSVTADKHDSYQNNILVDPGKETNLTVNLSFQAISVTWSVDEIEMEDKYEIVTNVKYETNVPMPVVLLNVPKNIDGDNMAAGETKIVYFTATNVGLMTAFNTVFNLPEDSREWTFRALEDIGPFELAPQQTIAVPIAITRQQTSDAPVVSRASNIVEYFNDCMTVVSLEYEAMCGEEMRHNESVERMAMKMCGLAATGAIVYDALSSLLSNFPTVNLLSPYVPSPTRDPNDVTSGDDDPVDVITSENNYSLCDPCDAEKAEALIEVLISFTNLSDLNDAMNDAYDEARGNRDESADRSERRFMTYEAYMELAEDILYEIDDEYGTGYAATAVEYIRTIEVLTRDCSKQNDSQDQRTRSLMRSSDLSRQELFNTVGKNLIDYLYCYENVKKEYFGDSIWYNHENMAEKVAFFDFLLKHEDATLSEILSVKPSDVTDEQVERLLERVDNYASNIASENTIDMDALMTNFERSEKLDTDAINAGYESLTAQFKEAYDDLVEQYSELSSSVCASITLQFSQKMTMTRQAFRGTLTVFNGHETTAMEGVRLSLEVRDEDGTLATAHEFQINAESLDKFGGELSLDAGWSLAAGETGVATILFIPTKYAAPTVPKKYSFGGTLSYVDPFTGLEVTRDLYPVTLTVKPSPNLDLTYFMQRDVFGDDALTDEKEPMVPAEFSLLINNTGYGDATNVRMVTDQPEIVDNEKGLLIDFELLSSQLEGGEHTLALGGSVATEFGNIPAHSTTYAQWWLQSSLLGHFTEYNVEATHVTSYGNEDLSLLNEVTIHELIRSLKIPASDTTWLAGFLVNDITDAEDMPDMLYLSDATIESVAVTKAASMTMNSDTEYVLEVTPAAAGWNYGSIIDPTAGRQGLVSIVRVSDGEEINLRNFWQTDRTLRDGRDPLYENRLHFADKMGATAERYLLTFEPRPTVELQVESFSGVPKDTEVLHKSLQGLTVRFNKAVVDTTFTTDDLTLNWQGQALDASKIVITPINEKEFKLDVSALTNLANGYYVLTVQTANIQDQEGFAGRVGKTTSWIQYADGKVSLYVEASPKDGGVVSPASGLQLYGDTLTLNATPAEGYEFLNWSRGDEVLSTSPTCEYVPNGDATVTASFTLKHYNVTLQYDAAGGTVTGTASGIYQYGYMLELMAEPASGYNFDGWKMNGKLISAERELTMLVTDTMLVEALFTEIVNVTLDYTLSAGWNWFSVNVNDDKLDDVPTLLAPIETASVILLGQAGELVNDPVYGWLGTLESLSPQRAYKLKVAEPVNLSLTGLPLGVDDNTITLESGWNWVGYLPQVSMPVNDALRNMVATTNDVVKGQDAFAMFDGTSWVGSLEMMEPGNGFLFYSQGMKSFIYPSAPLAHARTLNTTPSTVDVPAFWSYDSHRYADNMSIVAQLQGSEKSGRYLIAAFVDGECRGVATECRGYQFITVHHDAVGQTVRFKALDKLTGVIYDLNETASYQSGTLGNFKTPMSLSLGATSISPVDDGLYLKVSGNTIHFYGDVDRIRLVRIIGANGSVLKQIEDSPTGNKVDISALSAGVYIVTVNTDEGIIQKKVVKK